MAEAEDGANICIGSPLPEGALDEFLKEMEEETIPSIVEIMQRRAELAQESRNKFIGV